VEKVWRIEQLQAANQAYTEVLAFVSHELKNPIASMITDAQVLAGGYLGPVTEGQTRKLDRLMGKGGYLLDLIREYLDLARMEGGNLALRPRRAAFLEDVLAPAAELITAPLRAQGMTLETAVARAWAYVAEAIRRAPGYGAGAGPLDHGWPLRGG